MDGESPSSSSKDYGGAGGAGGGIFLKGFIIKYSGDLSVEGGRVLGTNKYGGGGGGGGRIKIFYDSLDTTGSTYNIFGGLGGDGTSVNGEDGESGSYYTEKINYISPFSQVLLAKLISFSV